MEIKSMVCTVVKKKVFRKLNAFLIFCVHAPFRTVRALLRQVHKLVFLGFFLNNKQT